MPDELAAVCQGVIPLQLPQCICGAATAFVPLPSAALAGNWLGHCQEVAHGLQEQQRR